jgi:hypothetical protein
MPWPQRRGLTSSCTAISLLIHALANWLLIVPQGQAKSQSRKGNATQAKGQLSRREVVLTGTNVKRDKVLCLFLPVATNDMASTAETRRNADSNDMASIQVLGTRQPRSEIWNGAYVDRQFSLMWNGWPPSANKDCMGDICIVLNSS